MDMHIDSAEGQFSRPSSSLNKCRDVVETRFVFLVKIDILSSIVSCQGPGERVDKRHAAVRNPCRRQTLALSSIACRTSKSATSGVTRRTQADCLNDLSRWPREDSAGVHVRTDRSPISLEPRRFRVSDFLLDKWK
jgi:hypothetical protein